MAQRWRRLCMAPLRLAHVQCEGGCPAPRLPQALPTLLARETSAAHLAGQGDLCVVGVAQQLRLLLAQRQRPLDQRRVVGLPRGRARDIGPVQLLPQRPAYSMRVVQLLLCLGFGVVTVFWTSATCYSAVIPVSEEGQGVVERRTICRALAA